MITNEIMTERLILRQLKNTDLPYIYRQFSDEDMCKYFSDAKCTMEEAQAIINQFQYEEGNTCFRLGIFEKISNEFIGTCGFHLWDRSNKRVEIGYDIWKDYWRKGYAKEAVNPLLKICFEHLEVECVYAYTHVDNSASHAVLNSLGFHLDGVLRGWVRVNDEQQAQKCFTLLKEEWRFANENC